MCFQKDDKSSQSAKCVKSRIMTKVIDCILLINKFEHQCVVLKGILQSTRLEYNVNNMGIDQSLINSALFKHISLQKTNKLYTHDGKCDNQQQFKYIL